MDSRSIILAAAIVFSACATSGGAQPRPDPARPDAIEPEADSFPYPRPVERFAFTSQRQRLELAYIDAKPAVPNGRTVLLLHGKNYSAAAWSETIGALTDRGFRVIAPDQIGWGKSSKPAHYQMSFAQLAHDTRQLLAAPGIERTVVVGHSMGGMLAVRYAVSYPAATERLVLVNPIGLEDYAARIPPRTVDDWYAQELKATPESLRAYQQKAYYDGAWKPEYEVHTQLPAGWTRHPEYPRIAWLSALAYDMILTQPIVAALPRIAMPTLLIIGQRDQTALGRDTAAPEVAKTMGDYPALGRKAQAAIPGAELVELDGLGHVPQVEDFARFMGALGPWIEKP